MTNVDYYKREPRTTMEYRLLASALLHRGKVSPTLSGRICTGVRGIIRTTPLNMLQALLAVGRTEHRGVLR